MFGYCIEAEETEIVETGDLSPCLPFERTEIHSKTVLDTYIFYVFSLSFQPNMFVSLLSYDTNQKQPKKLVLESTKIKKQESHLWKWK